MIPFTMVKPLYLKPSQKIPGANLVIYCTACNTNIYDVCRQSGLPIQQCKNGHRHRFKLYYKCPTTGKILSKTFESRDYEEVRGQVLKILEEVEQKKSHPESVNRIEKNNELLLILMSKYLVYLSGSEDVPLQHRKERSQAYVSETEYILKGFLDSTSKTNLDTQAMKATDVNNKMVGVYYNYLVNEKEYSNRSVNKAIASLRGFYNYLIQYEEMAISNPFRNIVKKPVIPNPQVISHDEFNKLLSVITYDNGNFQCKGEKQHRNYFYPQLDKIFLLFLLTGRRRNEVVNMKFDNILTNESGNLNVIKVEDLKVNRIQGVTDESAKKFVYVPVSSELNELLHELGYEKYKGTDKYIIAPEDTTDRKYLADLFSRAFGHYYSLLGTGRKLSLKCLRKTYITNLSLLMGSNVKEVTGHSGDAVLKHYINPQSVAEGLRGFSVFGSKESRHTELSKVRAQTSKENILEK